MSTKTLSVFLLTAFLLVFSISAVSALTFTQGDNSGSVTISNATVSAPTNPSTVIIALEDGQTASVSGTASGQVVTFTASLNYAYADLGKVYSGTANVTNGTDYQTVTLEIMKSFCSNASVNDSKLELSVDISSDGDEDLEWAPLDTITVDVSMDNNWDSDGDYDMNNVMFDFALFDETGKDVTNDLTWISTDEDSFEYGDVDEGDSGDHTFEFRVSPDIGDGEYTLFVKAYPDSDEDTMCIDHSSDLESIYSQSVSVTRNNVDDSNVISFDDINLDPSSTSCGQTAILTAKAYNIGTEKQEAVKIKLYNKVLGINQELVIENFKTSGDKSMEFSFDVPTNISEGRYTLDLWALHNYDKDNDKDDDVVDFDDDAFKDETDPTKIYLSVAGSCVNSTKPASASITTAFSDDTPSAVAGELLVIEATVTNTGVSTTNYSVDVTGNSAWSTLKEIDEKTFTLSAGQSKKVNLYFDVKSDASGEQSFTIRVNHGATYTDFQTTPFDVQSGLTASKISAHLQKYWFYYVFGLVNIILLIAIIIVIAKMSR